MEQESFTSRGVIEDVRRGLLDSPKWLSSLYFYDEEGSRLFDEITRTPEYYPTRTEHAILQRHADDILATAGDGVLLAELGSGASTKTATVLEALLHRQGPSTYVPVDVSRRFLEEVATRLEARHEGLTVRPIAAEYVAGMQAIADVEPRQARRLVLFLGSSIGNFEPEEQVGLLRAAYDALQSGDAFLLGTDLVKDERILEDAYNDGAGVTAAFNKNILTNLHSKLGGSTDLDAFDHVAFWNPDRSRIEMHLRANRPVKLAFPAAPLEVDVAEGETIHTENSYKFTMDGARAMAAAAGWRIEESWTDDDGWFALHLLRRP